MGVGTLLEMHVRRDLTFYLNILNHLPTNLLLALYYIPTTVSGCATMEAMELNYGNKMNAGAKSGETECATWCYETDGCNYWSLRRDTNWCWLSSEDDSTASSDDRVTGNKLCGKPEGM